VTPYFLKKTMKAWILKDQPGEKLALTEMEKPIAGKGEALVKIKAAALNHRDQWIREGRYPNIQYNGVPGSDGAGVVEKVGSSLDNEWVGKEVVINPNINWGNKPEVQSSDYRILGMPDNGTLAEYIVVPVDRLSDKPSHLNFEQAAAIPLAGLTAYRAVFYHGAIKKEQKVLISGIGGGVAQMAFLYARAIGAKVFVTSGSQEKITNFLDKGAFDGFNYKDPKWNKTAVKEYGGFDVIIDSAGGEGFHQLISSLSPGGKLVFYGATSGLPSQLDMRRIFWNQLTLQGSTMGNDDEFKAMVNFISNYHIKPVISSVRPFDQIISAYDEMKEGKQIGKLVVTM
jgi:zinc-binding alcohol dehydrogenase/oxidoreductase